VRRSRQPADRRRIRPSSWFASRADS
jgi:hypothetical protein